MRRAALHFVEVSDLVSGRLADTRAWLQEELGIVFERELSRRAASDRRDLVAALDVATSWEAWNLLREVEGCSVPRARRILVRVMSRLLAGS